MTGDSTSAFGFLGDVIFKWIPNVLTVIFESIQNTGTEASAPISDSLARPLSASDFPRFLEQISTPGVYDSLVQGWHTFVLFALLFSVPFLAVSVYCLTRVFLLRRHEERMFLASQQPIVARDIPKTQLRWGRILEQARSGNEHSWRLAILEADIMLNDLLDVNGYKGETMAEKMKQVDRDDFNSIGAAWEAHNLRNKIVHEGETHALSARDVRRVIGLYERIFREFHYIG